MIRIAKLTEYAILILSRMSQAAQSPMSASNLAEILNLSTPTVSKILKILSDASLVQSVRGPEGGYHLVKQAANISVADVITAMEGGVAMTECCESENLCTITSACTMRDTWQEINKKVQTVLAAYSVLDITGANS